MKRSNKVGILIATLVIPAFLFLFLKFFGRNKFDLPYLIPKLDDGGKVMIKANGDTVFHQIPVFRFINQDNILFRSADLKGKIWVVNFIFTRCGTICPTSSKHFSKILERIDSKERFHLLSFTVDPEFDRPIVLKRYAHRQEINLTHWTFLTGEKAAIYTIIRKGFKLPVADASEYNPNIQEVDQMFIHTDKFMLIDQQGYVRGIYTGTDPAEIDRLIVEIKVLQSKS